MLQICTGKLFSKDIEYRKETVVLAYQKVMMQVYLAAEIQEMNLQMEIVEPVLTGLTAAEAVNYLVRDHLLNEQEIDQLYKLLNQLELP
nr:hypothetical protein [Acinetobacter baumannii]